MGKHVIPFATAEEGDRELIDLAFSKKKADDRKEWLRQFKVKHVPNRLGHMLITGRITARHISGS